MTPHEFLDALIVYCALTKASVTSYGRTSQHNQDVGGVAFSAHQVWLGADLVYDQPLPVSVRSTWAERLGLRLVIEEDHDHAQPATWRPG